MIIVMYLVFGMMCGYCVFVVMSELMLVIGVEWVDVDLVVGGVLMVMVISVELLIME